MQNIESENFHISDTTPLMSSTSILTDEELKKLQPYCQCYKCTSLILWRWIIPPVTSGCLYTYDVIKSPQSLIDKAKEKMNETIKKKNKINNDNL